MVKNKGFLPSGPSEVRIQRSQIRDIIFSLYPACKDPDPDTGIPFKADAIIANPPAYGKAKLYITLNGANSVPSFRFSCYKIKAYVESGVLKG